MAISQLNAQSVHYARLLSQGEPLAVFDFEIRYRPIIVAARARVSIGIPEDDVQAFVQVLFEDGGFRLNQYRGGCHFASWLFILAHRFFYDRLHQRRMAQFNQLGTRITPLPTAERWIPDSIDDRLREAVHRLPAADRLHIRLVYVDQVDDGFFPTRKKHETDCRNSAETRILDTLKTIISKQFKHPVAVGDIRSGLRRLDLRFPEVGEHLNPERLAGLETDFVLNETEMEHLAGCDICLAGLLALKKESPNLSRIGPVVPASSTAVQLGSFARIGLAFLLVGLGWLLNASIGS